MAGRLEKSINLNEYHRRRNQFGLQPCLSSRRIRREKFAMAKVLRRHRWALIGLLTSKGWESNKSRGARWLLAPLAIVLIGWIIRPSIGGAHVHIADGYTVDWYPEECCHNRDCRPVHRVEVVTNGLVLTTDSGNRILVESHRLRRVSLDHRWQVCYRSDENPIIECVFEPPNS